MIEMAFRNRPLQQDSEEAVCLRKQYLQPAKLGTQGNALVSKSDTHF